MHFPNILHLSLIPTSLMQLCKTLICISVWKAQNFNNYYNIRMIFYYNQHNQHQYQVKQPIHSVSYLVPRYTKCFHCIAQATCCFMKTLTVSNICEYCCFPRLNNDKIDRHYTYSEDISKCDTAMIQYIAHNNQYQQYWKMLNVHHDIF